MDLIPIYEGEGLTLTEEQKALIPIKTEKIGFHKLEREIRTVGVMDYNETKVSYASTRVSGWIQKLYVNFTGTQVQKGARLLDIYSPELLVAQEEYLLAIKNADEIKSSHIEAIRKTSEQTLKAAESRLELLGLPKQQVQDIREHGKVRTELPLYAPISGTVVHMNVYNGQHVMRGMNLFRIADMSNLWLLADIYEYEMPWVSVGQDVLINVQSMPQEEFHGKVIFIYPYMESKTRTVKVQVEVPNPNGELRPGMYANVRLKATLAEIYTEKPKAHSAHEHDVQSAESSTTWTCPMHPQVKRDESGECPICGMDLVELVGEEVSTEPEPTDTSKATSAWTCPMHPQIKRDEPGECPICGMDLVELVAEQMSSSKPKAMDSTQSAETIWTCPMHPQIKQDEPGECPICGMDLVEEEVSPPPDATRLVLRADAPPMQFRYVCPDHPEKKYDVPGTCPEDGKPLMITNEVLAVPKSAVIDTGVRAVVFVDKGAEAGYAQVEVKLGPEAWAGEGSARRRYFPIISGLFSDDVVVTNGNYLLDSQTQLTGSAAGAYGGALGKDESSEGSAPPAHQH
jgi:multidrug efflux pump subunit AcrA (membrane-fusion protein)